MKYDIVTIGDAFEDVFVEPDLKVRSDRTFDSGKGICFEFGEKVPLNNVTYEIGGSACNTAVGFSRLGFKAGIVTVLGDDTPRDKVLARLAEEGVDSSNINIKRGAKTGFSVIFSINGDRTVFVYHGLKDYSLLKIRKTIKSDWYYVSSLGENISEIEKRLIAEASENGSKLAWNPGSLQINQGISHYRSLLRCTSVLFLNKEEAIKFLNHPTYRVEEVIRRIQEIGPRIVVVTDGKNGVMSYDGKELYKIPAKEVQRIDSTGAGDAFAVGFLAKIMKDVPVSSSGRKAISCPWGEETIKEALVWGIENSTSVIQQIGAQRGLLRKID